MATLVSAVTDEIMHELEGTRRAARTYLDGAITTGTTTITCQSLEEVKVGDYLEMESEIVYVKSQSSPFDVVCTRAERGSIAVDHTDATKVTIAPRWYRHKIVEKMKEEIDNLPKDVYGEDQVSVSFPSSTRAVVLTPTSSSLPVIDILIARRDPTSSLDVDNRVPVELIRDINLKQYASGFGIQLNRGWTYGGAETLFVTLAVGRSTSVFVEATDLEATVGLNATLIQAIKYGAIWRMNATREIQRSFTDAMGQSRRANEVQPMQIAQTALQFDALRDKLIDDERARLLSDWGGRTG